MPHLQMNRSMVIRVLLLLSLIGISIAADLPPYARGPQFDREAEDIAAMREAENGFTMIIATHKRDYLLQPLLRHLTTNPPPSLKQIALVWQNIGQALPEFLSSDALDKLTMESGVVVSVRESKRNSMNERFRPLLDWDAPILTKTVMIMDDDVVLRRGTLEWAYQVFKSHNIDRDDGDDQGRMVGFAGRDVQRRKESNEGSGGKWNYVVQPHETYSMVLSNAAFLKTSWLKRYWSDTEEMQFLRDYVDQVFNCDDLLINYLVSNWTRQAPLLLQPKVPLRTVPSRGLWNADFGDSPMFDSFNESTSQSSAAQQITPASSSSATAGTSISSAASASDSARATASPTVVADPRPDHWLTRDVCIERFHDYFQRYDPAVHAENGDALSAEQQQVHFPLVRTETSVSQDVVDRARWLRIGESWEAQQFEIAEMTENDNADEEEEDEDDGDRLQDRPEYDDDNLEDQEGLEELVGEEEFEALLAAMSDEEASDLLRRLEELGADQGGALEGDQAASENTGGGVFRHIADEL